MVSLKNCCLLHVFRTKPSCSCDSGSKRRTCAFLTIPRVRLLIICRERNAHLAAEGANLKQTLQDSADGSAVVGGAGVNADVSITSAEHAHDHRVRFTPDIDVSIEDGDGGGGGRSSSGRGDLQLSPSPEKKVIEDLFRNMGSVARVHGHTYSGTHKHTIRTAHACARTPTLCLA